tara:strand:+ start:618 stop:905 length:288 start_codon:yes stop_codon:yes gene_type:complete
MYDVGGIYGNSCSISADGRTALIAGDTNGSSGVAFIWTKNDNGTWAQAGDLSKSNANGNYGVSCSLSAYGTTALIAGYTNLTLGGAWIWEDVSVV